MCLLILVSQVRLTTLDLSSNKIATLDGLETLVNVEDFWFNDNLLEQWKEIDKLKVCKALTCVYLERNPIAKESAYRRKLKLCLPTLKQIDATFTR